jgi:RimJ/RimL family protein N-acetyltransferase/uncharacterized glyoxalase superfamily protein PhnB
MSNKVKLVNICPVFLAGNVEKTTAYYVDTLGFSYAKHFDKKDDFATVYRDSIEIVIVQKKYGTNESNREKYGNGYDAYIDTDTVEGIDVLYEEYKQKGVKIVQEPALTDYGSYEFVFEDLDGRNIGVGLIADEKVYFNNSNYREKTDKGNDGTRKTGFTALHETARLVIRRFRPDDWRDLYEYLSQPETVYYEPYDPFSPEQAKQEAVRRSTDENFYAVCLKESGKVIGNIYFAKQEFDTWEIGFVFNATFLGKGYATEAANALIDKAFADCGAHRIFARCNPENERPWKLLERLRFRREGHLTRNIFFKRDSAGNPLWQDTYMYGILDSEWKKEYP